MISVQQINTRKINGNTEKFITVKEIGKSKKNKLHHQKDYKILLNNAFETLSIEECQVKPESNDDDNSLLPSFVHAAGNRRRKKQ